MYLRTSSSIDAPPSVAWREGYPRNLDPRPAFRVGPGRDGLRPAPESYNPRRPLSGDGRPGRGGGIRLSMVVKACAALPGAGMGRGLASKKQVESKLRQLIDRLDEAG